MTPDQELELWWQAYLAALDIFCSDTTAMLGMPAIWAGKVADASVEVYKAKRDELLHES